MAGEHFGLYPGLLILGIFVLAIPVSGVGADGTLVDQIKDGGKVIDIRDTGPGLSPAGWIADANKPGLDATAGTVTGVPRLLWSYGCSATSATMVFGYYDRNGYPDMYTGPANGGVFPITNEVWGDSTVQPGQGECPLTASHQGYDGLQSRGQVDDYYLSFGSTTDPYYDQWPVHEPDSVADYMGTSMYRNWRCSDGSTYFFFDSSGAPLHDYSGSEAYQYRDGAHGMRLFAESRGYTVTANYNQYVRGYNGNTLGITYDQFKTEIDNGHPVLIQVAGHTMTGVGYSGTNQIIIHDTWDHSEHVMTWGDSYAGMKHYGVTVFHLADAPASDPPVASFSADTRTGPAPLTVSFTDTSAGNPTAWAWSFGDNSPNSTAKNPSHTYTAPGNYTVSLTVTTPAGSSSKEIVNFVRAGISVIRMSPETGRRGTTVAVPKLKGEGFREGATVYIKKDSTKIAMKNVTVVDSTKIAGKISVPAKAATGKWTVIVRNTDGTTGKLTNGFSVTA